MYFDFHIHPVFKKFLTKYEDEFPTTRLPGDLTGLFDLRNAVTDALDEEVLHFLESQCALIQMENGKLLLGIAAIAPIEFAFAASDGFFSKIMNSKFFTKPLDVLHLEAVRNGKVSYYRQFLKELELYHLLDKHKCIEILARNKQKELITNGKPVLALSMEGGHALLRLKAGTSGTKDDVISKETVDIKFLVNDHNGKVPLTAADSFNRFFENLRKHNLDLFYLTLTHLTHIPNQLLANHAFGFKFLKHADAYPQGFGITEQGKDLIDAAYNAKNKDTDEAMPVLIDIKHMSLKSRLDLYKFRSEKGYKKVPILATHMGVTGYSISEWKAALSDASFFKDDKIDNAPQVVQISTNRKSAGRSNDLIAAGLEFNPWSINLMDEDIVEVLKSEGLIGISMDVRILGVQGILQRGEKEEYFSREEFKNLFPEKYNQLLAKGTEKFTAEVMKEEGIAPGKEKKHALMFCLNVLHVISTALLNGIKSPWDQVCVGSDFDGLIEPVKNCRSVDKLHDLEMAIKRWMTKAEEIYIDENGGPRLLPLDKHEKVDSEKLDELIRKIMYDNGKAFINKWLSMSFKP